MYSIFSISLGNQGSQFWREIQSNLLKVQYNNHFASKTSAFVNCVLSSLKLAQFRKVSDKPHGDNHFIYKQGQYSTDKSTNSCFNDKAN